MNTDLLPVFVYGTLRHGLGNYQRILAGNTVHEEPATLSGATMYDGGGFPFVTAEGTGTVIGEVMYLNPATAQATMRRLDRLESFHGLGHPANMYDRVQVAVTRPDGTEVTAWVYTTAPTFRRWTNDMKVLASGDWTNRRYAQVAQATR